MFASFEPVAFPSRTSSPLSDFEHRVSPDDPNMSSAARYSPTLVQLPPSPFHDSVVVLENSPSSSPLLPMPESSARGDVGYIAQLANQSSSQSVPQEDTPENFTDESNGETLVSCVEGELILMQASNHDLASGTAPLMLTGIPSTDFTLARDFLVMHDEQMNVVNSFKNGNPEMTSGHQEEQALEKTREETIKIVKSEKEMIFAPSDKRCKNTSSEDGNIPCCDNVCVNLNGCKTHKMRAIADQPVPARAIATLPGTYLEINKLLVDEVLEGGFEYAVFAKRLIQKRTQFGPVEGVLLKYNGEAFKFSLPLLMEKENGEFFRVDVSNENTSNWMRFVRPALTYQDQNLVICQQNESIVFITLRDIHAKEELRAGPHPDYAKKRKLSVLRESLKEEDEEFPTLEKLEKDLKLHKNLRSNRNFKFDQDQDQIPSKTLLKVVDGQNLTYTCPHCLKIFPRSYSLRRHLLIHPSSKTPHYECTFCSPSAKEKENSRQNASKCKSKSNIATHKCPECYKRFATKVRLQQHRLVHGAEDSKPLPCNICCKRFMNNSALSCHLKTHTREKPTFECPMCKKLFGQILGLKYHIETHRNEDETFDCPHCLRTFPKYSIIRKHIRAHHCERNHNCDICLKRFPTVDKLRMHLLRHSDYKEFQCADCSKRFKRKDKLKEHMARMHSAQRVSKEKNAQANQTKKFVPKINPTDINRFIYKCHQCLVGFKRRGMLVNHLAKRHPEVSPDSVPELNLPIMRQTRDYYCQYCDKVYKSSSKRKAHIMKNHPGAALPPSNRQKEVDVAGFPNLTFSQTVGSVTTTPQGCQWCHKQYASKAKLLQHQRKKHPTLMEPADQVPRPRNRPPLNQNQPAFVDGDAFVISDCVPSCDFDDDFFEAKMVKFPEDVVLASDQLDALGRIRDVR